MLFRFRPLSFSFVAHEPIHFRNGQSANILRGAFGTIFHRLACLPDCEDPATCDRRSTCFYARFFRPSALTPGPSGFADLPRPFVFRASHLDGRTFAPGDSFHFELNLFDNNPAALTCLLRTFAQLAQEGLGPERRKVELLQVTQRNELLSLPPLENPPPVEFNLTPARDHTDRVHIRFLTPTELKSAHELAVQPHFAVLAARIRDRISILRQLYGDGPLAIDFHAFGRRASEIKLTRCAIRQVDVRRRSSRTGQVHSIGGFIGEAEYEGALSEFLPLLQLAQWTGVGRQTIWGKGALAVTPEPAQNRRSD